jgi:hypothetical protein
LQVFPLEQYPEFKIGCTSQLVLRTSGFSHSKPAVASLVGAASRVPVSEAARSEFALLE